MEFGDIVVHFNILDAMKHPFEDHSVLRAEILDQIVDDYMFDFDSLHGRKHPFLFDLHTCHSSCIEPEFGFQFDPVSDFYAESKFEFESGSDFLGVVPLDVAFQSQNALTILQEVHTLLTCFMRYRLRDLPLLLLPWFLPLFSYHPHQS